MNGFGTRLSLQKNATSGFETGIVLEKGVVSNGIQLYLDAGHNGSYPGLGNTWTDISGNGKIATLYNTPTYSTANSGILTFAKASYEYAETTTNLGNMPKWSVETWVKLDSALVAGPNAIVTNVFDGVNKLNYVLGSVNVANTNTYAAFFDGAGWHLHPTGQALTLGVWYHLVGTYDGATLSHYVNGAFSNSLNYVGTPQSGGNTRIARRWDDADNVTNNFVGGTIPIVRIYNRALTQTEITQNFNQSRGRYGI